MKIMEFFLNKSNSYKYYRSQNKLLKRKLKNCKSRNSKIDKKYQKIINQNKTLKKELYSFKKDFFSVIDSINQRIIFDNQKNTNFHDNVSIQLKEMKNQIEFINIQNNVQSIKNKIKNNEVINIVFIMYFPNNIMDSFIKLLEKDDFFNPIILLIPNDAFGLNIFDRGLTKSEIKEYENNLKYFKNKGFNVIKAYDVDNKAFLDIKHEIKPHIIFYSSAWEKVVPLEYKIENLSSETLFCYIPYGIYIAKLQEHQFNQKLHKKSWKIFCETPIHKKLAAKYSDIGASNVFTTGYPKMDPLIDGSYKNMPKIWKDNDNIKAKIIWAPHHSIGSSPTAFSTFDKNYKFFYEFAKKHTEIQWIFKPHFQLKYADFYMSETDEFSIENLEKYYNNWNKLDNAFVYEDGDYLNIFLNSDAMITDSVSFLAEYLYVNKPSLFLTREEQSFNEFGEIIIDTWYKAEGDDFQEIENFIENIVIQNNDYLRDSRKNIYDKYLNTNGKTASSNIYNHFKEELTK